MTIFVIILLCCLDTYFIQWSAFVWILMFADCDYVDIVENHFASFKTFCIELQDYVFPLFD